MSWWRRGPQPTEDRPRSGDDDRARWAAWRQDVFGDGYLVWHEGADTAASTTRWRSDPAGTEAALMLGLAVDDHVAAEAVEDFARTGGVPGPEVGAAVLAATRADRAPAVRIAAAVAAYVVTGDTGFAEVVVEVLLHRPAVRRDRFNDPRATAARLLTAFPVSARTADALADAVAHDPEYLVRYHAVESLIAFAGGGRSSGQDLVETISERGTRAGRAALARDLRAAVQVSS